MNTLIDNLLSAPEHILIVTIFITLLIILIAAWMVLRSMHAVLRLLDLRGETPETALQQTVATPKRTFKDRWNRIWGLRPLSDEKDLLIEHEYDGIKELDNPTPTWFNALFLASIVFAIGYLLTYHVFSWGMNPEQEYAAEMADAEAQRNAFLAQTANNIDENSVTEDQEPNTLASGKDIFLQNCGVCHGNQGEGLIGPNLTDEYWLHGGTIQDIFKVVKYGVPDKGMVPWESSLTAAQMAQVSNYILSLRGSNPPNPKEPQGDKIEP